MMWHDNDGWSWVWMTVLMALFWVPVTALVVFAIVRTTRDPRPHAHSAEEMLRRRFARGEIDDDEFQQRMKMLQS